MFIKANTYDERFVTIDTSDEACEQFGTSLRFNNRCIDHEDNSGTVVGVGTANNGETALWVIPDADKSVVVPYFKSEMENGLWKL